MKSALGFVEPGPASCSRIFSGLHTSCAMGAADAGISAIMQRIVGQIVIMNVAPDFCGGPIDKRINLDQMEFCIPLHFECSGIEPASGHDGCW